MYGRYVDGFYIIGEKEKTLNVIPLIREKLKDALLLQMLDDFGYIE